VTRIIQNLFGLVFGFFGSGYVLLWFNSGRVWTPLAIYCLLLAAAFHASSRQVWFRGLAASFCLGTALMAGISSYGYMVPTVLLVLAGFVCATFFRKTSFGNRANFACGAWVAACVASTTARALDHWLLAGQLFAFKWSRVEHPIAWTPYEIRPVDKIGRKASYFYDYNGADPSAVAILWGWNLFPKFAFPDEARPEGALLNNKAIQEAIR